MCQPGQSLVRIPGHLYGEESFTYGTIDILMAELSWANDISIVGKMDTCRIYDQYVINNPRDDLGTGQTSSHQFAY